MSGSPCCPPGSWGAPEDTGYVHKGGYEALAGVDCYVTGKSTSAKAVILSFSDVFPCLLERKRQVADQLAEAIPESCTVAPDLWRERPLMELPSHGAGKIRSVLGIMVGMPKTLYRMRFVHTWPALQLMLEPLIAELRRRHPEAHFFCYGYCFGAYVMLKCCSYLGFSAGLSFHPSPQVCRMQPSAHRQTEQELAAAVRCPVLLLPAGNDNDKLKEGGEFLSWLPPGSSSHTYENMKHGYMSRAALEDTSLAKLMGGNAEEVTAVQADALQRSVDFFKVALEKPPVAAVPAEGSSGL